MSPEVVQISSRGFWLWVKDKEYFLPYEEFPWFKKSTIDQICHVKLMSPNHLYWPDLDVDLEIESLENLEKYPLVYKKG